MINHILLIFSSVILYELIKYVRFNDIIKSNLKIYQKIIKLFKYKKVSDFRKEKLLLNHSKSLLFASKKISIILIFIFVFMILVSLLSNSYLNFVMSVLGIIEISIFFLIYHLIRRKFYAQL